MKLTYSKTVDIALHIVIMAIVLVVVMNINEHEAKLVLAANIVVLVATKIANYFRDDDTRSDDIRLELNDLRLELSDLRLETSDIRSGLIGAMHDPNQGGSRRRRSKSKDGQTPPLAIVKDENVVDKHCAQCDRMTKHNIICASVSQSPDLNPDAFVLSTSLMCTDCGNRFNESKPLDKAAQSL